MHVLVAEGFVDTLRGGCVGALTEEWSVTFESCYGHEMVLLVFWGG